MVVQCHLKDGVGPEYVRCTATVRPCRYGADAHAGFENRKAMVQYNVLVDAAREAGVDPAGLMVHIDSARYNPTTGGYSIPVPLTPAGFRALKDEDFQRNVEDITAIGLSDSPWPGSVNARGGRTGERADASSLVDFSKPVEALSRLGAYVGDRLEGRRNRALIAAAGVGVDGLPVELLVEDALDVLRDNSGMRSSTFDRMLGPKRSPEQLEMEGLHRITALPLVKRDVALEVIRGSGALLSDDEEVSVPSGDVDYSKLIETIRRGSEDWMRNEWLPTLDRFKEDYPEYADDWGKISGYARDGEWDYVKGGLQVIFSARPDTPQLSHTDWSLIEGFDANYAILKTVDHPGWEDVARLRSVATYIQPDRWMFLTRGQVTLSLIQDDPDDLVRCVINPDGTVDEPAHAARRLLTYGYRRMRGAKYPSPDAWGNIPDRWGTVNKPIDQLHHALKRVYEMEKPIRPQRREGIQAGAPGHGGHHELRPKGDLQDSAQVGAGAWLTGICGFRKQRPGGPLLVHPFRPARTDCRSSFGP